MTETGGIFDVLILGAGPAGGAAALRLAQAGRRVALLDNGTGRRLPLGESLPPAAAPLLHRLGVWERFQTGPHLPCHGSQSAWGDDELRGVDFIRDPNGSGWHLDRPTFDALLVQTARDAGAAISQNTAPTEINNGTDGLWRLSATRPGAPVIYSSRWLLDCTGRTAWLSRRLGVKRRRDDALVGHVSLFHPTHEDPDRTSLVESALEGWWYTAVIPGGARVVTLFTDAGAAAGKQAGCAEGFMALLERTRHVRERLQAGGYQIIDTPRATAAHTARAERCAGSGWLAAGDAALSLDPLSSQGLFHALASGLEAAQTLDAALDGNANRLAQYAAGMDAVFDAYRAHHAAFYAQEQRWHTSPFWRTRHAAMSVPGNRVHAGE